MSDRDMLEAIAEQLDRWAAESKSGGWSTHQVKPMEAKASEIYAYLMRTGKGRY